MRATTAIAVPVLLLAGACGVDHVQTSALHHSATIKPHATPRPATRHTRRAARRVRTVAVHRTGTTTAPMTPATCLTGDLSLKLAQSGAAAGSRYQPILFTNISDADCTLTGYPGVSFVAPDTGRQVGSAAARNPQYPTTTVFLSPGAAASALLQIVDDGNYSPADCHATPVSGLRVYPPGNTAAAYVPFAGAQTACASEVAQLAVDAVVAAPAG